MKALARYAAPLAGFATALLALLAVGGAWVRPAADDWCYQTNMRTMSVRQFVHFLYQDSNGRAGNAVLLAWVHGLGPLGLQLYPVVVVALLLGSLWLLVARLTRLAGRHAPVAVQLLTAATASLVFLLVCPQPYQTTYWASGGISHTVPAVLSTALVAAVLCLPGRRGRAGLLGRWTAALVLLLGFAFIALVSEAMALVVGVLAVALWLRAGDVCADRPARRAARLGALAAAVGSAGGLLVEYLSPGMHARSAGLGVPHGAELLHRLRDGVVTWVGDLAATVSSWDYAAVVLAGVVLGLTSRRLTAETASRPRLLRGATPWARPTPTALSAGAADTTEPERTEDLTPAHVGAAAGGRVAAGTDDSGATATADADALAAGQAVGAAPTAAAGSPDSGADAPTVGPAPAGAAGADAGGAATVAATGDAPPPALAVRSPLRLLLWATAAVLLGSLLVTELVQAVFGSWIWYMVRTWNDWRLPYTLLLAGVGVAAGRLLGKAVAPVPGVPRRRGAAALLSALVGFALVGLAQPAVAVVHQTRVRAHHWDAQQRQLEAQIRAGAKNPTYVPSYIGRMRDAYTRSGRPDWVASCIDDYYGTHIRLPAHSTDWLNQVQNAPIP